MKRIFAILLIFLLVLGGCKKKAPQPEPSPAPESSAVSEPEKPGDSPRATVTGLVGYLKAWELDEIPPLMAEPDNFKPENLPPIAEQILRPAAERLEVTVGESKLSGDKATVTIDVTVVDMKDVISKGTTEYIKYVALQTLGRKEADPEAFFRDYIAGLDWGSLSTTTTEGLVVDLEKNADGKWVLSGNIYKNREVADALTGGMLEKLDELRGYLS